MDITAGLVVSALHWAALISLLICRRPALSSRLVTVFALTLFFLCIPIAGVTPVYYLRGVFGEFSLTSTLVLCALAIYHVTRGGLPLPKRDLQWMAGMIAGLALWFYPMSLGLGMIDPYQWGYQPDVLAGAALVIAAAAWLRKLNLIVAIISVDLLGYQLGLLESNNLWDYLIDPVAAITAMVYIRSTLRAKRRAATREPQHDEHEQVTDDSRVVQIKGHVVSREKPAVSSQDHPASKEHGYSYTEPGVAGVTATAEKPK